jgi:hypothetical protein
MADQLIGFRQLAVVAAMARKDHHDAERKHRATPRSLGSLALLLF